jgi:Ig-like domain-containing protein
MKKYLFTLVISCLAAASLRADIVFVESFPYSNGTINVTGTNVNGTTNWFLHSGSSDAFVKNHRIEIASSSATAGFQNRSGDVHRNFTTQTNTQTILYSSFTVNCTNVPPAAPSTYFAHFYVNTTTFHGRVFAVAGSLPNTWRLGIAGAAGAPSQIFTVDLATNTDYQVVTKWNPTTDNTANDSFSATLWVNPLSSDDPHIVSSDGVSAPAASTAYAFRQGSGFGNAFLTVSNLAVATTFDEAATNIWSTNAVAPALVYDLRSGTNFPGENINLSAVFAGQGIGSITYQWIKDGVGIANPNGNSNVFTITGAATTDSGNYQAVATTPFSLSVTSATAFLWVTNAPIPPIITQQPPTNTTVFFHQNLSLHIAALGPLPVTFQWFRNNSPLSDGPNFSGSTTDTLLITDVFTNNGTTGTYRCDATSPFGTTPSLNAVVNAIAPPANSIAFLRTLVDTVNYNATNSALRWQATGVVTTFTNLTTGDTSSYYLQDNTRCGINIFVTHGSNFRPNQGDVITFVGWLSSFNSVLELEADTNDTTTSFTVLSNNVALLPAPKPIPFSITNNLPFCETNLEGSIVMLTNVYFGTNAGVAISTNANAFVTVSNAAGETFTILFSSQDLDTAGQILPEFAYSVVGVFNQNLGNAATPRNSAYQVEVTRFSDIVTNPLVISSALDSGTNTLSWDAAPYSYAYSVYSASNVTGPYVAFKSNLHFTNTVGAYSESVSGASQKFLRISTP